jgi:hypothetical protein
MISSDNRDKLIEILEDYARTRSLVNPIAAWLTAEDLWEFLTEQLGLEVVLCDNCKKFTTEPTTYVGKYEVCPDCADLEVCTKCGALDDLSDTDCGECLCSACWIAHDPMCKECIEAVEAFNDAMRNDDAD